MTPGFCDYCRRVNVKLRRIKTPIGFRRYRSFQKYIEVCPNCLEIHQLQNEPEIEVSELEHFVHKHQHKAFVPNVIKADDKEYIQFHDGQGQYMSRKDLLFIANEIMKTLELGEDLDEFIEETNRRNLLSSVFQEDENGKFNIPFNRLRISRKKFDTTKRKWSFKCGNCSTIVTSKDGGEYITIMPEHNFHSDLERACSDGCAKVIAKDIIQNWLNDNEDAKFFNTDNLGEQIDDYLKSI